MDICTSSFEVQNKQTGVTNIIYFILRCDSSAVLGADHWVSRSAAISNPSCIVASEDRNDLQRVVNMMPKKFRQIHDPMVVSGSYLEDRWQVNISDNGFCHVQPSGTPVALPKNKKLPPFESSMTPVVGALKKRLYFKTDSEPDETSPEAKTAKASAPASPKPPAADAKKPGGTVSRLHRQVAQMSVPPWFLNPKYPDMSDYDCGILMEELKETEQVQEKAAQCSRTIDNRKRSRPKADVVRNEHNLVVQIVSREADYSDGDVPGKVKRAVEAMIDAKQALAEAAADAGNQLRRAEAKLQDLEHYAELCDFDAYTGYRLSLQIREVRQDRRRAKDAIETVIAAKKSFDRVSGDELLQILRFIRDRDKRIYAVRIPAEFTIADKPAKKADSMTGSTGRGDSSGKQAKQKAQSEEQKQTAQAAEKPVKTGRGEEAAASAQAQVQAAPSSGEAETAQADAGGDSLIEEMSARLEGGDTPRQSADWSMEQEKQPAADGSGDSSAFSAAGSHEVTSSNLPADLNPQSEIGDDFETDDRTAGSEFQRSPEFDYEDDSGFAPYACTPPFYMPQEREDEEEPMSDARRLAEYLEQQYG